MPSGTFNCPLCKKDVSQNNFGTHLLSKLHVEELKEMNPQIMTRYSAMVEAGKAVGDLQNFKVKGSEFKLCLVCKKCYNPDSKRNEGSMHLNDCRDCRDKYLTAITAFCAKKEVKAEVVSDGAANKKIEEQAALIAKLQKQVKEATEDYDNAYEEQEQLQKLVKRLCCGRPVGDLLDLLDRLESDNIDVWAEHL